MTKPQPKIVCIGGGTGTFVALKGLKHFPNHLSAIITMSDSGGSNKRLRDEFGLLPTSDLRQCLVALSDENGGIGVLRKLFMYRFEKGNGIQGMTFGNLFMAALSDILGSQREAIKQTSKVLRIQGTVIPVSFTDTNLFATYEDGHTETEEHLIDEPLHDGKMKITDIYLKPEAIANPDAIEAILKADMIVLGPGDLFTSVLPNILVKGLPEALCASKAKKIYVANLMTKYGQTYNFSAKDHVNMIKRYVGMYPDVVVLNNSPIPQKALDFYSQSHEEQVIDDVQDQSDFLVVREDVVSRQFTQKSKSDTLVRSLIRHDSMKLASVIMSLW